MEFWERALHSNTERVQGVMRMHVFRVLIPMLILESGITGEPPG